ncbi:hypothetical protein GGS21DRAFT_125975 [Xylaria nigripes]|nr:hypothetical protein GGS21DRAFT_125975 [Xylaria nigripes]
MKCAITLAALLPAAVVLAAPMPTTPGIPTTDSARTALAGLIVSTNADDGTYERDQFPTWIAISGNCNTREWVLKRDGDNVEVGNDCYPTNGTWTSPYDGEMWSLPSDVDIDHMVPLKNAWISGANAWDTSKRQAFANDVTRPQLWAVTDNVNESKGDKGPDEWQPPLTSFYCVYARSYIEVKSYWELSITTAEKDALREMLDSCTD